MSASSIFSAPEIGCLTATKPQETRFTGSSSGVFFVNTVKQAFASLAHGSPQAQNLPPSEETLVSIDDNNGRTTYRADGHGQYHSSGVSGLGILPPRDVAQNLSTEYFRDWHPLFPFLSGPDFLSDLGTVYDDQERDLAKMSGPQLSRFVIVQSVINIAGSQSPGVLPVACQFSDPTSLLQALAPLAFRYQTSYIQAYLAVQLYLTLNMSLRHAASIGGFLWRSLAQCGLHRCPFRYGQLKPQDQIMRQRIFWSSYVLDRYLSQAIGIPLGISDSDVDVCIPTRIELHGSAGTSQHHLNGGSSHGPNVSPTDANTAEDGIFVGQEQTKDQLPFQKEEILANFVEYGRLLGRIVETFHKSIHVRGWDNQSVLVLRSDVDRWFNNLPDALQTSRMQSNPMAPGLAAIKARFGPFFLILYQQLIILLNRPSLSVRDHSGEFQTALQSSISAACLTISAVQTEDRLLWSGYLSSVWMSALIITFACQLGLYNLNKSIRGIQTCLTILQGMAPRWPTAQHCSETLTALLKGLITSKSGNSMHPQGMSNCMPSRIISTQDAPAFKRTRLAMQDEGSDRLTNSLETQNNVAGNNISYLNSQATGSESMRHVDRFAGPNGRHQNELMYDSQLMNTFNGVSRGTLPHDHGIVQNGQEYDIFSSISWEALYEQDIGQI